MRIHFYSVLKELSVNATLMSAPAIGQCYDGAAVMSGCNNGVQEKFRKEVPHALYVHCHAHRLNLTLVDCVRNIQPAAEFFEIVQMLYIFFSGSVVHDLSRKNKRSLNLLNNQSS